jgi:predicted ATPase
MLAELARMFENSGGRVVQGSGGGAGAMPALWSWVTVVRTLAAVVGLVPRDQPSVGAALALMGQSDAKPTPADVALSRTALYRSVIEVLDLARRPTPLAVLFDDIQWVDDETLILLSLAVDELAPRGVLFAVGLRTGDPGNDRVTPVLQRIAPQVSLRCRLPGLDRPAVAELARRVAGHEVDDDTVSALVAVTAGNPLFVTELLQLLAAERRLDVEGVMTAVPGRVHDVLSQRIRRLPASSIAIMQVAATAQRPVDLGLLAAVTAKDIDAALDDAEPALLSGLLVEAPGNAGFMLSHDLIRRTLLMDLPAARRVRLHARTGGRLADPGRSRS